jgi:hypothetical protein
MQIRASDNKLGYQLFYEKGDWIIVTQPVNWLISSGDTGIVTVSQTDVSTNIRVDLDPLVENGWGEMVVNTKCLQPYGITKKKLPGLIKAWKKQQIEKLLGVADE